MKHAPSAPPSPSTAAPQVRLSLLGAPRVSVGERELSLEVKHALLLAWLVLEGPTTRQRAAALLFPDSDEAAARNGLRQRLYHLRRKVGVALVVGENVLQVDTSVMVDLDGDDELLAGVEADELDAFAEWLARQRTQRVSRRVDASAASADAAEAEGDLALALRHATAIVRAQPESEHAHRRVMRLHYLRGDRAAALQAYADCREQLQQRLHERPSPQTDELRRQIEHASTAVTVGSVVVASTESVPVTVLRPPRLIGRDAEWTQLTDIWQSRGAALLVGEAGLGKSRLLNDLVQSRPHALHVTARPGDERVPYALVTKLLRALSAREPLPPALAPELARLLPELGPAPAAGGELDHARFTNAIDQCIQQGCARFDAVLVDDLHFADAASCEALLRSAQAARPAWVVAMRPAELDAQATALVRSLADERAATRIVLQPLTAGQVAALVRSLEVAREEEIEEVAEALFRRAGGNPLYTLETLRAALGSATGLHGLTRDGGAQLPALKGAGVVIGRRLERLSTDAIRLARCAAVAGQDFSITLAARVLGARPLDLADAWNELEAAQVFRDGAFAHDLIHEAALASVPPPIARELHREIAALLAADAPPATVAEHWRAAGEWAHAGASFMQAAAGALAASRRAEEAAFLEAAIDCFAQAKLADAEFDAVVQLTAALAWVDAGHRQQAALDRLLAVARTPQQRLKALTEASYCEANRGNRIRSLALAEEGLVLAEQLGEREVAFRNADTVAIGYVAQGRHEDALAIFESQRGWVETHGSAAIRRDFDADRSWALLALNRLDEAHVALDRAAAIAREVGNLADLNAVLALQSAAFSRGGDATRAIAIYEQAIALHGVLGTAAAAPMLDRGARGWVSIQLGFYRAALDDFATAIDAFDARGMLMQARRMRTMRSVAYLHLGQAARARQTLPEFTAEADCSHIDHFVLGLLERDAHGRSTAKALDHFRRADPSPRMASTMIPFAEVVRFYEIEAMAPQQQRSAAAELLAFARRRGQHGIALAALALLAKAAAACGEPGTALDAATECRTLLARYQADVIYRGDLWAALATALRTIDRADHAAAVEREAAAWIERAAREHVPDPFRESFLERNAVNRQLRLAAARAQSRGA